MTPEQIYNQVLWAIFIREKQVCQKPGQKVIAYKLPYTERSIQLSNRISVSKLQKTIQHHCPALGRASMGRLVTAHLSTRNLLETTRPRELTAWAAGGFGY